MQALLEMKNITKIFPGVTALEDVSFDVRPGEVHALMGENGAGKSTLVKILTGVHNPSGGTIIWHGNPVVIENPVHARALGISAVHQHVTGYPDLSLTENIFMGHEILKPVIKSYDWKAMHQQASQYLKEMGMEIDPRTQMKELSVAKQQLVEIAKAVSVNAELLIMDEPTAALSKTECEDLYEIIRDLKKKGTTILLISHRTEDVFSLADRVSVLRDAHYIGTWDISDIDLPRLSNAMVGRTLEQIYLPKESETGKPLFEVKNLSKTGFFKDISFDVRVGEIVSLTGLVGAGRTEVCQAIFGIMSYDSGTITLEGKPVLGKTPKAVVREGIAYLPEDRQTQGLILGWNIEHNISLANLSAFEGKLKTIDVSAEEKRAIELIEQLSIKCKGPDTLAQSLSGGNQQKVCISKLLCQDAKLLILDEPTKGVDVGAKVQIYNIMRMLAAKGYGILLISSEMNEVLGMSDRIFVMRQGRISASMTKEEATSEKILSAAMFSEGGELG